MGISINYKKAFYALFIIAVIILVISLFLWIVFPIIFQIIMKKNLVFEIGDGDYPTSTTFYWSKPPADTYMYFYFFNITNPDEVIYYGEKPVLNEVGPYAMKETEQKREIRFQNNGNEVAYENYKRYEFSPEHSCDGCRQDDLVVVPNSVALGALSGMLDPAYSCDDTCKLIIDIGLLLLGEAPFNTVKFIELTYDGYDDAFLTFAHSELFDALGNLFNNGSALVSINIPKMERMAYFYQYNNSNDENYLIKTGKADIDDLGKIVKWADSKLLPATWWSTVQARMINGSEAGSFNEPNLKKDSVIPFFQSFMCRSFYAVYKKESKVEGIPCYTFEVPKDVYDTTIDENIGFRYKNQEKINYFEEWNPCPNKSLSTTPNCPPDVFIDCSKKRNFCHECCQGNKVDGTFLLPPGFFPLACYPGKNETPPFTALYSAPHYHYAPEVILDTVRGMSPPVEEDHSPFLFDHEPKSGMVTQLKFRLMISMPMFRNTKATISQQLPNVIIPVFWIDSQMKLKKFMYSTLYTSFVRLPKAIDITKYVTLVVSVICFVISFWCRFNKKYRYARNAKHSQKGKKPHSETLIDIEIPPENNETQHQETSAFVKSEQIAEENLWR